MIDRAWLIQRGFEGFHSVSSLQNTDGKVLSKSPGVYAVLREESTPPVFMNRSVGGHFRDREPTVTLDKLEDSWITQSQVLYFGKAGHADRGPSIKARVGQYLKFGAGKPIGHWGGRYIWQLADHSDLIIAWKPTPGLDPRSVELGFIDEFEKQCGKLPFANLVR